MRYILEYIPLRILIFVLGLFPRDISLKIGKALGTLACLCMRPRYRLARKNILESLPGVSEEKLRRIIIGCWQNLGASAAELSTLPSLSREQYLSCFETDGLEHLKKSHALGKGLILLAAHYGPWEFSGHLFPLNGIRTAAVARRIKNPYVDRLVNRFRSFYGNEVILAKNAVRNTMRALKEGKMVCILMDHRVTEGDLQIPFLGRPAHTTSLPAILALKLKIPIHPVRFWREGTTVKVQAMPAVNFRGIPDNKEGIKEATQKMNSILEDWIREKPENWLWIHNRWKIES